VFERVASNTVPDVNAVAKVTYLQALKWKRSFTLVITSFSHKTKKASQFIVTESTILTSWFLPRTRKEKKFKYRWNSIWINGSKNGGLKIFTFLIFTLLLSISSFHIRTTNYEKSISPFKLFYVPKNY
jgi:hypothetical protein